jgi:hypothetical protein
MALDASEMLGSAQLAGVKVIRAASASVPHRAWPG